LRRWSHPSRAPPSRSSPGGTVPSSPPPVASVAPRGHYPPIVVPQLSRSLGTRPLLLLQTALDDARDPIGRWDLAIGGEGGSAQRGRHRIKLNTRCRAAACTDIFSSTNQPTGQPTNCAVSVTNFSVKVVQICKRLTKKVIKTTLCTRPGHTQLPYKYPFFRRVSEFLSMDVQCSSRKYDNNISILFCISTIPYDSANLLVDSKIQVSEFWSAIFCAEAQDMSVAIFVSETSIPPGVVSVKIAPQIIVPPEPPTANSNHHNNHGCHWWEWLPSANTPFRRVGMSVVGTTVCYYLTTSHETGRRRQMRGYTWRRQWMEEGDGSGQEATKLEARGGLPGLDDRR